VETASRSDGRERSVKVQAGDVALEGELRIPDNAQGVVLFAHGSGSGRHSPRNQHVARILRDSGLATLLLDLLTAEEEALDVRSGQYRFDINLLAKRVVGATDWLIHQAHTGNLNVGYFGASTGAAAALVAAAEKPDIVGAVVSRGGRPDLADRALPLVKSPTLLIVGGLDYPVIGMNKEALIKLNIDKKLVIVPGATHLFEEPGALEEVGRLATDWFIDHLGSRATH